MLLARSLEIVSSRRLGGLKRLHAPVRSKTAVQKDPKSKGVIVQSSFAMSSEAVAAPERTDLYKHGLKSLSPGKTMELALPGLSQFEEKPFEKSNFVKPKSVYFDQNGTRRKWDLIEAHDSIAVVLHHTGLDAFLLVRQFRPAVYAAALRKATELRQPAPSFEEGFTCELCAGIVDKPDLNLAEIAHEEIMEECGFNVPASNLMEITSYNSSVGTAGATQSLFFGEVDDSMRNSSGGGGIDGENIEVMALPVKNALDFVLDTSIPKSSGMMFGLMWFMQRAQANGKV
ncbi:hypothetical protein BSKO_08098 [Bryopsis sp. KO-2023]|nr:hypothetical protein BSKO_08098 [Bryopsis sp. KO-2023]